MALDETRLLILGSQVLFGFPVSKRLPEWLRLAFVGLEKSGLRRAGIDDAVGRMPDRAIHAASYR
jgi:hypothetical protein